MEYCDDAIWSSWTQLWEKLQVDCWTRGAREQVFERGDLGVLEMWKGGFKRVSEVSDSWASADQDAGCLALGAEMCDGLDLGARRDRERLCIIECSTNIMKLGADAQLGQHA